MSEVTSNPWTEFRKLTAARIALGRAGTSLPTSAHLNFQFDHAQARDAVHRPLDADKVFEDLSGLGLEVLRAHSAATDRNVYLQRPDLGRRLDAPSREKLVALNANASDVALVVADGLSSFAIETNAQEFITAFLPLAKEAGLTLGPATLALQGRVALGDEIGEILRAKIVLILIGERPGLSSPDSMGLYLTYAPQIGRTDAERNCISNIRPEGLSCAEAARKTLWLLRESLQRGLSGIQLKDDAAPSLTGP